MKIINITGFNLVRGDKTNNKAQRENFPMWQFKHANSLTKDVFQKRSGVTFGAIPKKHIIELLNKTKQKFLSAVNKEEIIEIQNDFRFQYNFIKNKHYEAENKNPSSLTRNFWHEFAAKIDNGRAQLVTHPDYIEFIPELNPDLNLTTIEDIFKFQKSEIKDMIKAAVKTTNRYFDMEKWAENPNLIVPANKVASELKEAISHIKEEKYSITGVEQLIGKKIKNPEQAYNLLSQPLLNAERYAENKSFEIKVEKIIDNNKEKYYAYFINPDTQPISNENIDKLILGNSFRDIEGTRANIRGTGQGISEVVRILKENGYEKDIPNLFEKNREKGVCVRVPIIGIQ